jgi:hypothetical protein
MGSPAQLRRRTCERSAMDVAARGDVMGPRYCSLFVLARRGESRKRNLRAFRTRRAGLVVLRLRHEFRPGRHSGARQVGFADLPASPESITPGGRGGCAAPQLEDACRHRSAPAARSRLAHAGY